MWADEPDSVVGVAPLYPLVSGSLKLAEERLEMEMGSFANDVAQYQADVATRAAYILKQYEAFNIKRENGTFVPFKDEIDYPDEPIIPERLVITPTGTGKSYQARIAAAQIVAANPGQTVGIAAPSHGLTGEYEAALKKDFKGLKVAVYRGRKADDPSSENNAPMCALWEEAGLIGAAGGDVQSALCRNKKAGTQCPYYDDCSYLKQKNQTADIWVYAHTMMTQQKPSCMGDMVAQFVDEDPSSTFLAGVDNTFKLSMDELYAIERQLKIKVEGAEKQLEALKKRLSGPFFGGLSNDAMDILATEMKPLSTLKRRYNGIKEANEYLDSLPDGAFKPERKGMFEHDATKAVWGCAPKLEINPGMTKAERAIHITAAAEAYRPIKLAARLFAIINEAYGEYDDTPKPGIVPGVRKVGDCFTISWKKERTKGFDVPTMFMDATGQEAVYKGLFPNISKVTKIDCSTPYVTTRQITNWNGSMNKLVTRGEDEKRDKTATNNTERLARIAEARAAEFKGKGKPVDVLIVTYKATCEAMKLMQDAGRIPGNVEFIHYGGLAGLDRWKDVACLIMAGWAAKGVDAVEARAELLKGDKLDPISNPKHNGWYAAKPVGGRKKGADLGPELEHVYHDDPIAEAVRWQMMEGELIQALGRGRGVRRGPDNPLQIDVITNIPLPIEVDEYMTWEQVQPTYLDMLAARGITIYAESSAKGYWATAHSALADMYISIEAIRAAGKRLCGHMPIGVYLYANDRLRDIAVAQMGIAVVRVRKRGKLGVSYTANADLLKLFGPDAMIEVITPPQTPKPAPVSILALMCSVKQPSRAPRKMPSLSNTSAADILLGRAA